ncbi:Ig-like domain-containing protein [candidate division KSB1 bacterium]|nr:Ig-like domain-containing protein [candidate division KSB1 bacterium]
MRFCKEAIRTKPKSMFERDIAGFLYTLLISIFLLVGQSAIAAEQDKLLSVPQPIPLNAAAKCNEKPEKGILLSAPKKISAHKTKPLNIIFSEGFESSSSGWSIIGGVWEIGTPTSGPGSAFNSNRCAATDLNNSYPAGCWAGLISPSINLPVITDDRIEIELHFWTWYAIESGYDYGVIKITDDDGQTWNDLSSQFDGTTGEWELAAYDLTMFAGSTIRLAFYLYSDGSNEYDGWFIDDIQIDTEEIIQSGSLEIAVSGNGQFTMGTTDYGPILLYGHPSPWSSATTVRIDGEDYWNYRYRTWGTVVSDPTNDGLSNSTTWNVGPVRLKQTLTIVSGSTTGEKDTGEIKYTVTNVDNTAHSVGLRIMLDTMLADNDGAPFRIPGTGAVTTEYEYLKTAMPLYWQAFDDLTEPTIQSQGTLAGGNATKPDRFITVGWNYITNDPWEYNTVWGRDFYTSGYGYDSAIAIYWYEATLESGESRDFVTYYGLGGIDVDIQPPLVAGLSAPRSVIVRKCLANEPFTLMVYLSNTSPGVTRTAQGVSTVLHLPSGLSLLSGEATHYLPDLSLGADTQTDYQIQAEGTVGGRINYTLDVNSTSISSKTVSKDIYVFGIETTPADEAEVGSMPTISATFNLAMDVSTINESSFLLSDGASYMPGTVSYDASTRVATFIPDSPLEAEKSYTAIMTTDVTSMDREPLSYRLEWQFSVVEGDNWGDYLTQKQGIIDFFLDDASFYVPEEAAAQDYLTKVQSRYSTGTASEIELESIARLCLSEQLAKDAYMDADEIADISTDGLSGSLNILFFVISKTGGIIKLVKKIPFIGNGMAHLLTKFQQKLIKVAARGTKEFITRVLQVDPNYYNWGWRYGNVVIPTQAKSLLEDKVEDLYEESASWGLETTFEQIHEWIKQNTFLPLYEWNSNQYVENGISYAKTSPHIFSEGQFKPAKQNVEATASEMSASNTNAINYGRGVLNAADLVDSIVFWGSLIILIGAIIAACATGVGIPAAILGLLALLSKLEVILGGAKLGTSAILTGYMTFFMPHYVEMGTNQAFDQSAYFAALTQKSQEMRVEINSALDAESKLSGEKLTGFLNTLKQLAQAEKYDQIEGLVDSLAPKANEYEGATDAAFSQILAGYPYATAADSKFEAKYYQPLRASTYGYDIRLAGLYLALAAFKADPVSFDTKAAINGQIDTLMRRIDEQVASIEAATNELVNLSVEIPPYLDFQHVDAPVFIEPNLAYKLTATVRNLSTERVEDISVSLSYRDSTRLFVDKPVQFIAALDANEGVPIEWEFAYKGVDTTFIAFLDISPASEESNFKSFAPTPVILTLASEKTPSTMGSLDNGTIYAYPNPFNPSLQTTTLRYSLAHDAEVTIKLYDAAGDLVKILFENRRQFSGVEYAATWDGTNESGEVVANGVYFYMIKTAAGEKAVGKIAVLR